jgi:hypothetical protein
MVSVSLIYLSLLKKTLIDMTLGIHEEMLVRSRRRPVLLLEK